MLPHTLAVYDTNCMLGATTLYRCHGIAELVVKQDRKNGGIGIHHFRDIEDVYNQAAFGCLPYPFVIQPFFSDFRDIRIIILGNYLEGYERVNPANFRHNLHCGGTARIYEPDENVMQFCRRIMARGGFPYAHIDLMVAADGSLYLTEINLRGGLRGARIDPREYLQRLRGLHARLLEEKLEAEAR